MNKRWTVARSKTTIVYRVQDAAGDGPYDPDSNRSGFPRTRISLPTRGNKDFYQPLPEDDFSPEDFEEFMGQGEEGHGAGHYLFGFPRASDAGNEGRPISLGGHQVFFEPAPSWDPARAEDAGGFDHPEVSE